MGYFDYYIRVFFRAKKESRDYIQDLIHNLDFQYFSC